MDTTLAFLEHLKQEALHRSLKDRQALVPLLQGALGCMKSLDADPSAASEGEPSETSPQDEHIEQLTEEIIEIFQGVDYTQPKKGRRKRMSKADWKRL